ncbi:MAG: PAS domain S-box protein, partial [Nitrospiria bacterium]
DLDFRVGTKARDEIGQLSRSFDKMTENIGKISASRNALTQGIQESLKSLQREITEREKAEREARESEARIHSILDTATDAIITIGEKGIIETFNHSAEQIFGYTSREVVGHNISMLMPSPDREKHDGYLSRYMETGKSNILGAGRETLGQRKDASTFPIELSVSKVDQGDRMIFTGIIRDITKQKKADRERQLAATVFNASTEAITITDADKKILSVNPAFSRITGYSAEEVIGKTPQILQSGLLDANFYKKMWDTINTVGHWQGEIMNKRKDGKFYPEWLSITKVKNQKGKVIQYIGLFSDITEKKNSEKKLSALNDDLKSANDKLNHEMAEREQMEIELRMAQKLEAVGQLAAGIAHEINTPMQYLGDNVHFLKTAFEDYLEVIETYQKASLALSEVPGQEALIEEIKEAEEIADLSYLTEHLPKSFERTFEGIERVSTIVKAMKDFSHPDQREKSLTDINKGLTSTLTVARNEYKYVADIKTEFGKLPHILCHAGEINQVFLNLIVNAAHAIGDEVKDTQEKGKIYIKTEVENNNFVLITIRDSGTGIPEEIRKRVFDPFFTTKEVGRGTGQGLAIARSTVKEKHGGSLTLESKVGQGTTFFIRLPIHEDDGRNNNGTKPEESI